MHLAEQSEQPRQQAPCTVLMGTQPADYREWQSPFTWHSLDHTISHPLWGPKQEKIWTNCSAFSQSWGKSTCLVKSSSGKPFQLEKRWLSIDLIAVFPYLWLSRKHSQGVYSSACQRLKAVGINQNKRGPSLMQGKGFSWYTQKLKQAAQRCCVVSIPIGF